MAGMRVYLITLPLIGEQSIVSVCVCVCVRACVRVCVSICLHMSETTNYTSIIHQILCACHQGLGLVLFWQPCSTMSISGVDG